jgi:hypothetical protein
MPSVGSGLRGRLGGVYLALTLLSSTSRIQVQSFIIMTSRSHHHDSLDAVFGDLAAPNSPQLDDSLIAAARVRLSWEKAEGLSFDDKDEPATGWESGKWWEQTRLRLVELWVLPRDMSNGADDRYSKAAKRSEMKLIDAVPQLLRLPPSEVIASAKAVLRESLPAALLRNEPVLLSYPASHIEGGFEYLLKSMPSNDAVVVACRSNEGLLVSAIERWTQQIL